MELIDRKALLKELKRHNTYDLIAVKTVERASEIRLIRCCECGFHVDYDGVHFCKFFNCPCPDDSDFYCKAGFKIEEV